MGAETDFTFYDPGVLRDRELLLKLVETRAGVPDAGLVPTYDFAMTLADWGTEMGSLSLRVGDTPYIALYCGHIGYSVKPKFRGHHYAARACRLLLPLARRHGLDPLWITCNPDNLASRRTCELLGATFVEIVDLPEETNLYRRGERQKCRYRLDLF